MGVENVVTNHYFFPTKCNDDKKYNIDLYNSIVHLVDAALDVAIICETAAAAAAAGPLTI